MLEFINKIVTRTIVLILLINLIGCGWWETTFGVGKGVKSDSKVVGSVIVKNGNTFIVEGGVTVTNGAVVILEPGAKVKFKTVRKATVGGEVSNHGSLAFTGGAKMIAKGTKENPIVFEVEKDEWYDYGDIFFKEDSSNETILEYCEFKESVSISMQSSGTIQYCKGGGVSCEKNSKSLIFKNTFKNISIDNTSPTIKYNNINFGQIWIGLQNDTDVSNTIIEYNNITTKSSDKAISLVRGAIIVNNNYIADSNGQTGVDTTGSQSSSGVVYQNPRTTPVPDAGCGW